MKPSKKRIREASVPEAVATRLLSHGDPRLAGIDSGIRSTYYLLQLDRSPRTGLSHSIASIIGVRQEPKTTLGYNLQASVTAVRRVVFDQRHW